MAHKTLELAFIGGCIKSAVGTAHNIACRIDHRFNVSAAVFSLDQKVNQETAAAWNINEDRLYTSYQELLENEKDRVSAIVIVTPTQTHADISIAAIEAGYPVICEKALTASIDDANRIKNAVENHSGFLAVTYNYIGYPMVREIRHMIMAKAIGKLSQIHIEMPQDSFARVDQKNSPLTPQQWRLDDSELPIISTDLGVHLSNMITFLSNEQPLELVATQNSYGNFNVIDNVNCLVRYTNDMTCNIWFSKIALGYRNGLKVRIFGDKGSLSWNQMEPEVLIHTDICGMTRTLDRANSELSLVKQPRYNRFKAGHPSGYIEAFANCYSDIGDAVTNFIEGKESQSEYVFGVDNALSDIRLIDAMNRSAQNKQWVKVDLK